LRPSDKDANAIIAGMQKAWNGFVASATKRKSETKSKSGVFFCVPGRHGHTALRLAVGDAFATWRSPLIRVGKHDFDQCAWVTSNDPSIGM
jgi:hypothetical protein